MSETIPCIAAEGTEVCSPQRSQEDTEEGRSGKQEPEVQGLVAHTFGSRRLAADPSTSLRAGPEHPQMESWEYERERRIYRRRTVSMLRRYMRYSIETGRLPSLVGREFFRSNVTKYRVTTFEDRVIFVHDMERCLERLDEFSREVLGRIVLQEYEYEEVGQMFGYTRMTVHRKLLEALDQLSEILLEVELLDDLSPVGEKSCQEGKVGDFSLSDCAEGK